MPNLPLHIRTKTLRDKPLTCKLDNIHATVYNLSSKLNCFRCLRICKPTIHLLDHFQLMFISLIKPINIAWKGKESKCFDTTSFMHALTSKHSHKPAYNCTVHSFQKVSYTAQPTVEIFIVSFFISNQHSIMVHQQQLASQLRLHQTEPNNNYIEYQANYDTTAKRGSKLKQTTIHILIVKSDLN